MMRTLGVGVLGYGAIARVHTAVLTLFAQIYPEMAVHPRIVAITPGGPESCARALRDFPMVPQLSYDAMLASTDVDVVVCATPTELHFATVKAALLAGKHVMCEKPLTVDVAQSQQLVQIAALHQRVLAVNHHFRHVPAIREMQRRIATGALGTPISAHLRYFRASNVSPQRPLTWRFVGHGAGVLVDLGSHLIDLIQFVTGSPIERVQAELRTVVTQRPDSRGELTDVTSDDVAWLTARLANGMRVTIEASKMVPGAADDVRVEVYGTRSSLMFDMLDVNALVIGHAESPAAIQRLQLWNRMAPSATLPSAETTTGLLAWHAASWQQCIARIHALDTPLCDGHAGMVVDAVIRAAQRSAASNSMWVEVTYE